MSQRNISAQFSQCILQQQKHDIILKYINIGIQIGSIPINYILLLIFLANKNNIKNNLAIKPLINKDKKDQAFFFTCYWTKKINEEIIEYIANNNIMQKYILTNLQPIYWVVYNIGLLLFNHFYLDLLLLLIFNYFIFLLYFSSLYE